MSNRRGREFGAMGELDQDMDLDSDLNAIREDLKSKDGSMKPEKPKRTLFSFILSIVNFFRLVSGAIVENTLFQYIILLMIIVNSLMMAISTYTWVSEDPDREAIFSLADQVFLIIFTVELCLQFVFHGFRMFVDGWLVFDFTTIVLSWSFQNFQVIRAFRVFRALRLITRIKVLKNLVLAIGNVLPSMGAIFGLLILVLYIFAVMFTSLFQMETSMEEDYFKTLHQSLFTLFQMLTLDWIEITRELLVDQPWARYPVVAFILFSGFIVYNLFVAVLCDAIYVLNEEKEDEEESILKDEDGPRLQREIMALTKRIEKVQEEQGKIKAYVEDIASSLLYLDED